MQYEITLGRNKITKGRSAVMLPAEYLRTQPFSLHEDLSLSAYLCRLHKTAIENALEETLILPSGKNTKRKW